MDENEFIVCIVWALVAFLAGALLGGCLETHNMEKRAIKAGVGEYYINDNLRKDFRWRTNQ